MAALAALDAVVPEYRLFMLNAQPGVPDRDGVIRTSRWWRPSHSAAPNSTTGWTATRPSGALHSPGGLAVIALPSWHPKADVSTVVPRLTGPVTSFQHSFIVSEQGTAAIWGHDSSAQAEQIITQVAHPRVRGELREAGRALGFRV